MGLFALTGLWIALWMLPVQAWFRKSIEAAPECPHCGSKDIRISHVYGPIDRLRVKLGLAPFRCRGCTRRFFSRSSRASRPEPIAI